MKYAGYIAESYFQRPDNKSEVIASIASLLLAESPIYSPLSNSDVLRSGVEAYNIVSGTIPTWASYVTFCIQPAEGKALAGTVCADGAVKNIGEWGTLLRVPVNGRTKVLARISSLNSSKYKVSWYAE